HQGHTLHAEAGEHVARHAQLALAAVDEKDIRQLALAFLEPPVAALEGLGHGAVVVAGGHPLDIEAPVVGLDGALGAPHHAGRHRRLAAAVADIEALDARRRRGEAEAAAQGLEAVLHGLPGGEPAGQALLGAAGGQFQPFQRVPRTEVLTATLRPRVWLMAADSTSASSAGISAMISRGRSLRPPPPRYSWEMNSPSSAPRSSARKDLGKNPRLPSIRPWRRSEERRV